MMRSVLSRKLWKAIFGPAVLWMIWVGLAPNLAHGATCSRALTANVAALDHLFFYNRLGAVNPAGMIFALRGDIVPLNPALGLVPGNVQLRSDKRPRPLVLRMNVGDCLQVSLQNLLASAPVDEEQPATRTASVHAMGMQLVRSMASDGSNVGQNASSLAPPGGRATYTFYAEREGAHLLYSAAATTGGEGDGGSLTAGLFGAVNVEPRGAEWYRSQVTQNDLELARVGQTADGHPILNYDAVYPNVEPWISKGLAGRPILKMLNGSEIVHSDLTAIITGPNQGRFPAGTYRPNPTEPDRDQPFREFTFIYHDEIMAVQAFPAFEDPVFEHTLHGVRDGFAINYGTAGVGAEIIANRFGVGPMWNCTECKYEEFFLASSAVGDPAMVVDVPANVTDGGGNLILGPKATRALYPDDPSNVYHSYIRDHVKFRLLHGGAKEHHIHHLHAHQWMYTPDSDHSAYLDSQAIGPGSAYTLEILYNGSGNRNQTVGDSIFHCHFYPHFAQGMWALWRTHDVFEAGTQLDAEGRPAPGSRALPDGEIAAGTPIPAVVPLPTRAMAPMPGPVHLIAFDFNGDGKPDTSHVVVDDPNKNPGYPLFVPMLAGHMPPQPPLDLVDDGGLPRHVIIGGMANSTTTRLDFSKELATANAVAIPLGGTPVEQAAMAFHGQRCHDTFLPNGAAALCADTNGDSIKDSGGFITNGLPRKTPDNPLGGQAGAPFADPCIDDNGNAVGTPRVYKTANIQLDMILNKAGWHFPQARMIALWEDVAPTLSGTRPPEPFFFRANSQDCITYYHTNLVPHVYELDDFQVRTPTDIIGQHIHLVKFDVTSSDGSSNGWNYMDGTFAPIEVQQRIAAINAVCDGVGCGLLSLDGSTRTPLAAQLHPFFKNVSGVEALGAQTTVQRWYADPVLNNAGEDRTLTTVYTHDHFSPSTHQQVGLYAGLLIEPQGSRWRNPETGVFFGEDPNRVDGGPTSWRADILTANSADSYREFMFEFADFQLAYTANDKPIDPPAREEVGLPFLVAPADVCPGGVPLPCPEAISAEDPGTMTINYRNEPLALRVVVDPDAPLPAQAAGDAGDLSKAYLSNITRAYAPMNLMPGDPGYPYPAMTAGVQRGDPFTSLMRAYEKDRVQVRILVGAQEEGHNFTIHGLKWLFEPSDPNSGYRNSQIMGISEHFEFHFEMPVKRGAGAFADYLYQASSSTDDQWNGAWGILRGYTTAQADLLPLPNNDPVGIPPSNLSGFNGICPTSAPVRRYHVTAITAQQALPTRTLAYNSRTNQGGQLHDPTAILYVRMGDLDAAGKLRSGVPVEPLILRARAGECLEVTLINRLPALLSDLPGFFTLPMIVENFNANQVAPSSQVGLHPQLVHYDATQGNGFNVGFNPLQTVGPGGILRYRWYAGDVRMDPNGGNSLVATPVEFGAINLMPADPIKHPSKGAIGALIIEPQGSTWVEEVTSRASATVTNPDGTSFREFVVMFQNSLNLRRGFGNGAAVPNTADSEDSEDSGQKALNYRTEPTWKRLGYEPDTLLEQTRTFNFTNALSNAQVGGDPVTPIFTARMGTPVRFRVLHPGGNQRNHVFQLHGHIWEKEPYTNGSTVLGSNSLSEWLGGQAGIGPSNHLDLLLKNGAGGGFRITGDYLYRDMASFLFDGGLWGIFRVTP